MPPKQRIMMISTHGYFTAEPELGLPDTGGQVVFVLELSKHLGKMGYGVDIYTRQFEKKKRIDKVDENVRVISIPCGGKKFIEKEFLNRHIPEWIENAYAWIQQKKLKYQFINSHYWDAGLAGVGLSNKLDIPHLHTPHSIGAWKRDNMDGDPKELEKKYNFKERVREENVIYDEADAVIATTPLQRELLLGKDYTMPRDKIYVIPPGYDDSRFFPVSLESREGLKRQYGYEGKIILALGRLARNKGYDLLVRSMKPVFDRIDDAKLLLCVGGDDLGPGEAEMRDELKQIAEEIGYPDRVVLEGYIPDEQLGDFYRLGDVFALSSRYEPFGMTAVEAMACGTPTVVTTEGGLWEQVQWGYEALYANPFDHEAYGFAIYSILKHPEIWDQLARHGSHKARASFTWMGIAQQMLSVLHGFRVRKEMHDNRGDRVRRSA